MAVERSFRGSARELAAPVLLLAWGILVVQHQVRLNAERRARADDEQWSGD